MTVDIAGPAGRLEGMLDTPADPRAAVVFAHPHPQYGGTMHTKVVFRSAKALAGIGCAVLRFNFRGVGQSEGAYDEGRGERDDFRAGLDFLAARYPALDLWAAGFSFGGWIALAGGVDDSRVSTLVTVAPAIARGGLEALAGSRKPKFFVQGDRDEICPLGDLRRFYAGLPEPKELVVIDGADHLFDGKVLEVGDALQDLLRDFDGREGYNGS